MSWHVVADSEVVMSWIIVSDAGYELLKVEAARAGLSVDAYVARTLTEAHVPIPNDGKSLKVYRASDRGLPVEGL